MRISGKALEPFARVCSFGRLTHTTIIVMGQRLAGSGITGCSFGTGLGWTGLEFGVSAVFLFSLAGSGSLRYLDCPFPPCLLFSSFLVFPPLSPLVLLTT